MAEFKKLNESELNPLAKKLGAKLLPKNFGQKKPRYVYEVYWYTDKDCSDDPIFKKFPSNKARQLWYEQHKNDPDKFNMSADLDGYNVNENLKEDWVKRFRNFEYYPNEDEEKFIILKKDKDGKVIDKIEADVNTYDDAKQYIKTNLLKEGKSLSNRKIDSIMRRNKRYLDWSENREKEKAPREKEDNISSSENKKEESLNEDTIKQNGKWVNKGKEGTHGTFKTKKQADKQRAAMFANGFKGEGLKEGKDIFFAVVGYDKDDDVYDDLKLFSSFEDALKFCKENWDLIKYQDKEIYDWLCIDKYVDDELESSKVFANGGLQESKLTEAPDDLGFETDDELEAEERAEFERRLAQRKADRDSAKQKELDRQEQERKDKEARDIAAKKGEELYNKFKTLKSYDDVFELLVPGSGKADTVAGELWRAIARLEYRFFNDGDKFYEGYGRETCGSSAVYLFEEFDDLFYDYLVDMVGAGDSDYERCIEQMKDEAFNYLKSSPEFFGTPNEHDSRSSKEYDIDKVDDFDEPRDYEYSVNVRNYYNDDLDIYLWDYLANEIIDSFDFIDRLKEDVDAELRGNSEFEVDTPWGHYDEEYTITNLTKDEFDTLDNFLDRQDYFDSYIEELYNEYGDPNDKEEEVEESLNENKSDYKTLREIISLFKQYAPDDFINEFGNEENALDILKDNLYGDEYLGYNIVDLLNEIVDFGTREEKEKASRLLKVVKLHKGKRG